MQHIRPQASLDLGIRFLLGSDGLDPVHTPYSDGLLHASHAHDAMALEVLRRMRHLLLHARRAHDSVVHGQKQTLERAWRRWLAVSEEVPKPNPEPHLSPYPMPKTIL